MCICVCVCGGGAHDCWVCMAASGIRSPELELQGLTWVLGTELVAACSHKGQATPPASIIATFYATV